MKKKKIAITGGIGSGKSSVANILKELGFSVFSCDEVYKNITQSASYIQKIQEAFPDAIVNNCIDKQRLAKIVFSNENARKQLNSIAHPLIMEQLFNQMEDCIGDYVFAEVPLLFEEKLEGNFDEIWVIIRDLEGRIQSAMLRDGCDREDVIRRIKAQYDYENSNSIQYFKEINAILIENNKGKSELKQTILSLIHS